MRLLFLYFFNKYHLIIRLIIGLNWLKTASGVRVTFWTEHITAANAESSEKVLSDSLTRLSASPCDVLLTASFPLGVYNFAAGPFGNEDFGNLLTSKLAKAVSPKYHFCPNPSGVFHQRYPYRNDKILTQKVTNHTRFITLGNANNSSVKWFYLFSLDPSKLETCDVQTECPYTAQMFEQRGEKSKTNSFSNGTPGSDSSVNSFRWQSSDTSNEHDSQSPANKRRKSNQMASRECWFCLKSESCAKHLIVYVNDNNTFYIALAKGGIHAQHVLIVPVDHHRSAASLPDSLDEDLDALKTCICKFFKQQNKVCVMYERSYSQMHFVLQVVAIDENLADIAVPTFFSHANKVNGISIEAIKPPNSLRSTWDHHNKCNYFHVEFPSGEEFFIPLLIHNFPINFGRQILCDRAVLKCPENVDWKTCVGTQEEEEKNRNDLRTQFDSFLDTYD